MERQMFIDFFENFDSFIATGGLFDFNATLPFIALQFLLLMFALDNVLYTPLTNVIKKRKDFIECKLTYALYIIFLANSIKEISDLTINTAKKRGQDKFNLTKKEGREFFISHFIETQKEFDELIEEYALDLAQKKEVLLNKTEIELEIEQIGVLIKEKIIPTD